MHGRGKIRMSQTKASRNRTVEISEEEVEELRGELVHLDELEQKEMLLNSTINGDLLEVLPRLPDGFADLIIIDPPYNLTKSFDQMHFKSMSSDSYEAYVDSWLEQVCNKLSDKGSLYLCGDWKSTAVLQKCLEKYLTVINRITWQREKGRGAKSNWKNGMEDIWFAVKNANNYYFNVEAVKQKRKVIAPYKENGKPKDWKEEENGNFRITYPSNFWDDISIPFWSMPENTEHPTQKPEKLYAKLILASSKPNDIVFDPFLGSGTASVVAKKLGRNFVGVEINEKYCLYAIKRLKQAEFDKEIQGYADGVFWERNSLNVQKKVKTEKKELTLL